MSSFFYIYFMLICTRNNIWGVVFIKIGYDERYLLKIRNSSGS